MCLQGVLLAFIVTSIMSSSAFKPNYSMGDVHSYMADYAGRVHRATVAVLQYIGERCVKLAREKGTYNDITGNLRNSVGYVLVKNGAIISKNFEARVQSKVESSANGKGVLEGEALAVELASRVNKGYAVIVVAGMHYAHYVETLNKDVLDSAERWAETQVPRMMQRLKTQVYNAFSSNT